MKTPQDSNDAFSITVLGMWNPGIFSPQWVKANLSDIPEQEVALAYSIAQNTPPRITVEGVNIFPALNALAFNCVETNDASISACAEKLKSIATLLPHTPVNAIGINFRYVGEVNESADLAGMFNFIDAANIDSNRYKLSSSALRRSFKLAENDYLNLSFDLVDSLIKIEFNYHSDISTIEQLKQKVENNREIELRHDSIRFLQQVYGINIED